MSQILQAEAPALTSQYGTGGNNQPLVMAAYDVRLTLENSKVVRNRIYEANTSRTISTEAPAPEGNQGGLAIIYSSSKNSHHTKPMQGMAGSLVASDYKDPPTVAYGIGRDAFNQGRNAKFAPSVEEELQPTLTSRGPGAVQSAYAVRRLTPTECARLQGFPDWWCSGLATEEPTAEDLAFWRDVFETYRRLVTKASTPKTDNQITKWLKAPHSDGAEYKMWGNGVALPCAYFVLAGIAWAYEADEQRRY